MNLQVAQPEIIRAIIGDKIYNTATQQESIDVIHTSTPDLYHVIFDHVTYAVKVESLNMLQKTLSLKVNGKPLTIELKDEMDQLVEGMGYTMNGDQGQSTVTAPMPGLVVEVQVEKGQEVKKDQNLLILEAMKMENIIKSPRDGMVKSILVETKNSVVKGAVLIELE